MKVGPGLKIKSGKNEFKLGGRIHFDVGMYNNDKAAKCEVNDTTDGSCLVSGTNFRRLRLAMSGKYDDMFYYKASVDWGGLLFGIGVGDSVQVGIQVNGGVLFDIGGSLKMNAQATGFAVERIGKWIGVEKIQGEHRLPLGGNELRTHLLRVSVGS